MSKKKIAIGVGLVLAFAAVFLYFVPAFEGTIIVSPIIDLGPLVVRWYGLIIALAILTAYFVARKYAWRFGIDHKEVDNVTFWLVIAGILGARLYYILFAFDYFVVHPDEVYKIWHGGLSIYGALIAGLIFAVFYSKDKAYSKYQILDLLAISLPLAQAVGRLGNFFNQEAFGTPTELPWKMYVSLRNRPPELDQMEYFHPTFFYEAIISVIIFLILSRMVGKVKSGILTFTYLGLYSLSRFFIEALRVDSVYVSGFRVDQVIAFIFVVGSALAMLNINRVEKR